MVRRCLTETTFKYRLVSEDPRMTVSLQDVVFAGCSDGSDTDAGYWRTIQERMYYIPGDARHHVKLAWL